MKIILAHERTLVLHEQLTMDQAEGRAWSKKADAFGGMTKITKFVKRPRDDDFQLVYKEHRYQPFWHVVCCARSVYERKREYPLALSGPEVESVTIDGHEYPMIDGGITLTGPDWNGGSRFYQFPESSTVCHRPWR